MIIVGVVGGIGSGKSAVCRWVAERDRSVRVIDADGDGHRILLQPAVQTQLRAVFGDEIFGADGRVIRSAIARRVFGEAAETQAARRRLEAIVHPAIADLREQQLREFEAAGDVRIVLVDAAILLEAGWRERCDAVVLIDVPRELRLERVRPRGWTEAELDRREGSQWPLELKKAASDFVVDNSGTLDNAGAQMYEYMQRLAATDAK